MHTIDKSSLQTEASRCLSCYDPPCERACPASVPIPRFIRALMSGNIDYAAELVRTANPLISTCGEVCPAEDYCMDVCTRKDMDEPVEIRLLHKFATDFGRPDSLSSFGGADNASGKKIAVVGAGPGGMSCAVMLRMSGSEVTVFEKQDDLGGVPANEIPKSRLPDDKFGDDTEIIRQLGIEWKFGIEIKEPNKLLNDYDAVFLSTGLPRGRGVNVPGEDHSKVHSVLEFLRVAKSIPEKMDVGRSVVVVGGGNVSLDAASAAYRLGAEEVHLLYRRGVSEMKVWESELREATELGVMVHYLCYPREFVIKDGKLRAVLCGRNSLSNEVDRSGRRKPVPLDGYDFELPCDTAVIAIGLDADEEMAGLVSKETKSYASNQTGLFVGGDLITGEGTIVEAVRHGKEAAAAIIDYLEGGE